MTDITLCCEATMVQGENVMFVLVECDLALILVGSDLCSCMNTNQILLDRQALDALFPRLWMRNRRFKAGRGRCRGLSRPLPQDAAPCGHDEPGLVHAAQCLVTRAI